MQESKDGEEEIVSTGIASTSENGITRRNLLSRLLSMESSRKTKPDLYLTRSNRFSRRSRSHDDALAELEHLVEVMRLNDLDEDLLDRAERRDLPTKFQLMRSSEPHPHQLYTTPFKEGRAGSHETLPGGEIKAPPVRRSALPDLFADDLAVRRLCSPRGSDSIEAEPIQEGIKPAVLFQGFPSKESYLLYNRALTPFVDPASSHTLSLSPVNVSSIPSPVSSRYYSRPVSRGLIYRHRPSLSLPTITVPNETDSIDFDDVSFRKYLKAMTNVPTCPPFGIPRRTVPASTKCHYLNVALRDSLGNQIAYPFREKKKIIDDMAVRKLRKDLSPDARTPSPPMLPVTTVNLLKMHRGIISKSTPCLVKAGQTFHYKTAGDEHDIKNRFNDTKVGMDVSPISNQTMLRSSRQPVCHQKQQETTPDGRPSERRVKFFIDNDVGNESSNKTCKNKRSTPFKTLKVNSEGNEDKHHHHHHHQGDFLSCKSFTSQPKQLDRHSNQKERVSPGKGINHISCKTNDEALFLHRQHRQQQHQVDDYNNNFSTSISTSLQHVHRMSERTSYTISDENPDVTQQLINCIIDDMKQRDIFGRRSQETPRDYQARHVRHVPVIQLSDGRIHHLLPACKWPKSSEFHV